MADTEDNDEVVMLVNPAEQQLQHLYEEQKENDPHSPVSPVVISPAHSDISLSPAQRSNSDCIIIDTDVDQIPDAATGQYDDAPEEEDKDAGEYSSISDSEGYDSNALYCICRQKHNKRFMICCDSCQEWFHGDCVGIRETEGRKMERKGQEYICPPCVTKKQSQLQSEYHTQPQPESELSFPQCLTLSLSGEEGEGHEEQQALKETVEEEEEEAAVSATRPETESEGEMETDNALPLCIGPGCPKPALPDSVYCGTDCILQHAAVTMKTLSGPKVPKPRGRAPRKAAAAAAKPAAKGQRSGRTSQRLARKVEEVEEEETKEDDGRQKEAASPLACDPSLTGVQATSIPSSNFYTASNNDSKQVEAVSDAVTPSNQSPSSEPVTEPVPPPSHSQEQAKESVNSGLSKQRPAESKPSIPTSAKSTVSPATQSPTTSSTRHHETGALMVTKTTYVIPKKQSGPQPPSSHVSASTSSQKPSSSPTLLNETRNLPVPPAPSAPSSRPSQPNNQVRQSIQRSLTSILVKRICDCEDLEMAEKEVAKLVASVEMEMFDIFRNTDSKYMNKYRTIMFNLKDPRNKGLLYRVVHGEISPFRLVRMSQKDMQATKAPEPSAKETPKVKDATAKATGLLQQPEAVKVDLPSLNPPRPDRRPESTEQKKSLPTPAVKTRVSQASQGSAVPDILACMLKDTTSEHKAHLFDLKCKICTGQIQPGEEEEPTKKKTKVSETRDKHYSPWGRPARDDSPLRAPPDSPDMDSPPLSLMDPTSRLIIDSPVLTIVESPASPIMDSPASPALESPASPVMDSPASPTPDPPKAPSLKRAYTPVVIPAVSTVSITRRDPRTAAGRISASPSGTSAPSNITRNQAVSYAPLKETSSALLPAPPAPPSSLQPTKTIPKSILMKPSSSTDPRLYGTSRTMISESPADGETAQFLAKQEILWKGFLNMLTVAKFVTKGYLVSGSAEILKADLPDTIQIGGRIMPQTVWDYVTKLKTSATKELCVIRFHPATEEEEVAYVSLFSYFSSRGRFGVVANNSRAIKDIYLVPLSAKESIPSILQPFDGPGLEKDRPNLLLGLAIIQKPKRTGNLPLEIEEKRPKVHMSKDPMWIPKPPVLYGSDKLEIFQPYDPETPASTTPPGSPSCPGSPSDSSSSGSVTIPSLLTSIRAAPPVSTSATVAASQSTSNSNSGKNPLQTILKTLFGNKQTDSIDSSDVSSSSTTTTTTTTAAAATVSANRLPEFSKASGSMVDPIVQQYGHKSKVKELEDEENDFDRPYDPEEEYDPSMGYGVVSSQTIEKIKTSGPALSGFVDDDVAYDPEDESIFEDIQSDAVIKPPVPTQMSDSPSCPVPISTQVVTPAPTSSPAQTSTNAAVPQNLPTGTVVVSAATLTEQQRMLEELNKQIEEQKRQLKEQEEALRQQREAVGMFMAHFSVSDSLMSPPQKSLPLSQIGIMQIESKPSESTDKSSNLSEAMDCPNVDSKTDNPEDTTAIPHLKNDPDTVTEQAVTQENDKYSSAGEIEDSDVAYDPEDESLFDEIQDDVFQGSSTKSQDSSLTRSGHKGTQNSYHSRKRRPSPKKRSHRERERHRSPSRKSQQRSPSHSRRRRERDRHRRSERDRSRHRVKDQSERHGRHRKDHTHRHFHGRKRSPSSPRKKDLVSFFPKQHRGPSPHILEKPKHASGQLNTPLDSVVGQFVNSNTSSYTPVAIQNDPDGQHLKYNLVEITIPQQKTLDKDFSHEHLHNVKLEITEPPISVSDSVSGSSTQVDKLSQQETLLNSKIDSTVPLREIDPPLRDSPESPDPDPRFVKPSNEESSESVKIEETRDPETNISCSVPLVKIENSCLPVGQETLSNTPWATNENTMSNVTNLNFRAIDLQDPGVGDHDRIDADNQKERDCKGLKQEYQECAHSNPATEASIQGSDIRNQEQDIKDPGHRGPQIDLRDRFPGIDMRNPGMPLEPHIQDVALSSQMKHGVDPEREMKDSEPIIDNSAILCPSTDRPLPGILKSRHPLSAMHNSFMGTKDLIVVDERISQEVSCLPKDLQGLKTEEQRKPENQDSRSAPMSAVSGRDPSPDIRNASPSFTNSGIIQRHSRCESSPDLEQRALQKRGFQPPGGDADLSRRHGSRERSLDSNVSTGSEGRVQRASPSRTDDRFGSQRGRDVPMQGPNTNYEIAGSNLSFVQDSSGSRDNFKAPGSDIRVERSVHDPDFRKSETMHDLRRPDMRGKGYMRPGQDVCSMSGSDTSCDRSNSYSMSSGRDIQEKDSNKRGEGIQGQHIHGPWLERKNEQMCQENRGPFLNIKNPDWRDSGPSDICPDISGQRIQNRDLVPHMRDSNWRGQGSDIRDGWRGPDRRGSGPVGGGPFLQEMRVSQSDRRGPNMESQGPDRRGAGGLDFRQSGPEMRNPNIEGLSHDLRGTGVLDNMGPGPERRGPDMDIPVHNRRGPGGPDFIGSGFEKRPHVEGSWPDRKHPVGPDNSGPGSERKGQIMDCQGPGMRGPGGPAFAGPGLERRGPALEVPGPDNRHSGGPHFRAPLSERTNPPMEGPGQDMRGPEFSESWPERQGPDIGRSGPEGPDTWRERPDRRGPRDPNICGPGPERRNVSMEGPGHDRRGPVGPNFRGQSNENRGPAMEGPGPDRRGSADPHFGGPGPERKGPPMGGPGPHRREPGVPDFCGPVRERRGSPIDHQRPFRRGYNGPDNHGPGPERRGSRMDRQGPDNRESCVPDFSGPGQEKRGPPMDHQGPDRRGTADSDFHRPRPERRGSFMDHQGPHRREPEALDFSGPGQERGGSFMDHQRLDRRGPGGPDFHGPESERRGSYVNCEEPNRRGPGGPDLRGPGSERRAPNIEGQGSHRMEVGDQNISGLGPDRRGTHMAGPGSDFRGPGPKRTGLGMEGPGPHNVEQGGPNFMGPGPEGRLLNTEGPRPDGRGPGVMGPRPEIQGSDLECPMPDRIGQRAPEFMEPGLDGPRPSMECPGPNRRGPRGPNMKRPWLQPAGPHIEGPGSDRSGPEGPDFRGPGPKRRPPDIEGTGHSRFPGGPHFSGPGLERRPPDIGGPGSDRRSPQFRGVGPERPVMEGPGPNRKGGLHFRGPSCESRAPDIEGSGPDRQEPEGPGFRNTGFERRDPDMEGPGPDWRKLGGPDFRGISRTSVNAEHPRHIIRDWGGADFEGLEPNHEGPDREGPGSDRTGQNLRGPRPLRRENAGPDDQWSGRKRNERECTEDEWDRHGPIQECLDEQGQEHGREGPCNEWRGPGCSGPEPLHERPSMQFSGRRRGSRDDWSGPGSSGPGSFRDSPNIMGPGPGRGPGNEWREPGRGRAGLNRKGPFFRRQRDPENRGQVHDIRGPGMRGPGSDMSRGPDMRDDWVEPDFRVKMRGPNMEGPGPHRGGPGGPDLNRRGYEMQNMDRRGPGNTDLRWPGLENRNSIVEGPGSDGRCSELPMLGCERKGVDMDGPGPGRQGFESDFRRERRGPDMRGFGPDLKGPAPEHLDKRCGSGRWEDISTGGPESDRRGPDIMGPRLHSGESELDMKDDMQGPDIAVYDGSGPAMRGRRPRQRGQTTSNERRRLESRHSDMSASPHFNSVQMGHQVNRFHGPNDSHSALLNRQRGPSPNSGGKSCPGFDNPQNQQAVRPQRQRAALLPTPTEGLIRFPNRLINSPKQKQMGHPTDREWNRGTPVTRERELVKGQEQEQEKSPAGMTSTPIEANKGGGEEKKEGSNETDNKSNDEPSSTLAKSQNIVPSGQ